MIACPMKLPIGEGLVIWLPLQEGSGRVTKDFSEYDSNGGLTTSALWVSEHGGRGAAVSFGGGSGKSIIIPDRESLRPGDGGWTIVVRCKDDNSDQISVAVNKTEVGTSEQYTLGYAGSTSFVLPGRKLVGLYYQAGLANVRNAISLGDVADGKYKTIAMVADKAADKINLYSDFKLLSSTQGKTGAWPVINSDDRLTIGSFSVDLEKSWSDQISGVAIFNRAMDIPQLRNVAYELGLV